MGTPADIYSFLRMILGLKCWLEQLKYQLEQIIEEL